MTKHSLFLLLYTSHMGSSPTSPFAPMIHHAATENRLEASGMAYTSLRNGYYASMALMMIGGALKTGELILPEDGPVAWTTHADLAEAAAAIASEVLGRSIRRIVVSDEEFRERMKAQGVPEASIRMRLGMFLASRRGDFAPAGPALADLIGRPPTALREVLAESIASLRG